MKIILASPRKELLEVWGKHCGSFPQVEIVEGSVFDVKCDALVSPANSFGIMDGGIDAQFTAYFGEKVQDQLRLKILTHHQGELLIGRAEIIETEHEEHPYLIAAPTMRVPMILDKSSINPYLATRATILAAKHSNEYEINSICFPGMGTGVGRVSFDLCAHQMAKALAATFVEKYRLPHSWIQASEEHQELYQADPRDLQFPDE
ncbi:MAG: macro domain-containing protein [Pseudomonadota bacterium]